MALVDYSSDSGPDEDGTARVAASPAAAPARPTLPPLPESFHDLYASTVRASTRDDPALHQGRTRQIPHVAGNWPSHIYVEWYPSIEEYELLGSLLTALRLELGAAEAGRREAAAHGGGELLHSFLTSDLSTPLPLHISLSRPVVLSTAEKDDFLDRLTAAVQRQSGVRRFSVRPRALSWHRSPDSNRAFLVLQVQGGNENSDLAKLLTVCNDTLRQFGQPSLYAAHDNSPADSDPSSGTVSDKFHVSIGWSFVDVVEELRSLTTEVYQRPGADFRDRIESIEIPVDCVKVKIGNVITRLDIPDGWRSEPAQRTTES